ncbi:MAG: HpcH/HpaI aldolase/citrate lyase family protein [Gemmatimonadaceae bacterium]
MTHPARSWLFVPATRADRFAKAAASGADRIIVDLEDAVATDEKDRARESLAGATLPDAVPVYVRVNGAGTLWFERDLAVAAGLRIAGILLPKANTADDVGRAVALLPANLAVVPIAETAAGVWNVLDVAKAPNVERVAFGALDFELDTGMRDDGGAYDFVRSRVTLASRVARIGAPIDSVCLSIGDEAAITTDAERGRRFGCCGKLCIHPNQVRAANTVFRPSAEEIEWAASVLAARASRPRDAVFSHRGALVDRPVIDRASQIIELSAAITDRP